MLPTWIIILLSILIVIGVIVAAVIVFVLKDDSQPAEATVDVSDDNTSITLTFDAPVYTKEKSRLRAEDLKLSVTLGEATLSSYTMSTSDDTVFVFTPVLSGLAVGTEVAKILGTVYNEKGHETVISVETLLSDLVVPSISTTLSVSADNKTVTIAFSEPVFQVDGKTPLTKEQLVLTLTPNGGSAVMTDYTIDEVVANTSFVFNIVYSREASGVELVTLSGEVYDVNTNLLSLEELSVPLSDMTLIASASLVIANDNDTATLTLDNPAFNSNGEPLIATDFKIQDTKEQLGFTLSNTDNKQFIFTFSWTNTFDTNNLSVTATVYIENDGSMFPHALNLSAVLNDMRAPLISQNFSLAVDNKTASIVFDEKVYETANGAGDLPVFLENNKLSVSGGQATLDSYSVTSSDQQTFVFTLTWNGVPTGEEQLSLASFNAYDSVGNVVVVTESSVSLYDELAPAVVSFSLSNDNQTATLQFSEPVYASEEKDVLQISDFTLSDVSNRLGTVTLNNTNNTTFVFGLNTTLAFESNSLTVSLTTEGSTLYDAALNQLVFHPRTVSFHQAVFTISSDNLTAMLTFPFEVTRDGTAPMTVSDFVFTDSNSYFSSKSMSTTDNKEFVFNLTWTDTTDTGTLTVSGTTYLGENSANFTYTGGLNDTKAPQLTSFEMGSNNSSATLVFHEPVYMADRKTPLDKNVLLLSLTGDDPTSLTLDSYTVTSTDNDTKYTFGLSITGGPVNTGQLTLGGFTAYDASGSHSVYSAQSVSLYEETPPTIVSADASTLLAKVRFSEHVYRNTNRDTLLIDTFTLSVTQGSAVLMPNNALTLAYSDTPPVAEIALLWVDDVLPQNGDQILVSGTVYDFSGNALTFSETVVIDTTGPQVTQNFSLGVDNKTATIVFDEEVYDMNGTDMSTFLASDKLSVSGGQATLGSYSVTSTDQKTFVFNLTWNGVPTGEEQLSLASFNAYDSSGNEVVVTGTSVSLYDELAPSVESFVLDAELNTAVLTFSESVYKTGGTSPLLFGDFTLIPTGFTLGASTTMASSNNRVFTFTLAFDGAKWSTDDTLQVTGTIYDATDNVFNLDVTGTV